MEIALNNKTVWKNILIDMGALALIYFLPASVHLTGIPLYMIEPMRLMLIISMAHGAKSNSYLLALSLPLFSFAVSGHPEFLKMLIITGELVLNTVLFYWLTGRSVNTFLSLMLAIIISKIACYLAYWPIFSFDFVIAEASPVFIAAQIVTTLIFSFYVAIILKKQQS